MSRFLNHSVEAGKQYNGKYFNFAIVKGYILTLKIMLNVSIDRTNEKCRAFHLKDVGMVTVGVAYANMER